MYGRRGERGRCMDGGVREPDTNKGPAANGV